MGDGGDLGVGGPDRQNWTLGGVRFAYIYIKKCVQP